MEHHFYDFFKCEFSCQKYKANGYKCATPESKTITSPPQSLLLHLGSKHIYEVVDLWDDFPCSNNLCSLI